MVKDRTINIILFLMAILFGIAILSQRNHATRFLMEREKLLQENYDVLLEENRRLKDSIIILNVKYNELDEQYWKIMYTNN